jgi:hypothetical protein
MDPEGGRQTARRAVGKLVCCRFAGPARQPERFGGRVQIRDDLPAGFGGLMRNSRASVGFLSAIEQGDPHAAEQLLPLVYEELRKVAAQRLAQEKPGQTLQATARSTDLGFRHWTGRCARGRRFTLLSSAPRVADSAVPSHAERLANPPHFISKIFGKAY